MNCKAINSRKIGLVLGCFSVIIMPQKTKKTALHKLLSADQADLELQPPERSRENSERALGSNFLFSGPKQNSNISNHRSINSLQSLVSLFLFRRTTSKGSVDTIIEHFRDPARRVSTLGTTRRGFVSYRPLQIVARQGLSPLFCELFSPTPCGFWLS